MFSARARLSILLQGHDGYHSHGGAAEMFADASRGETAEAVQLLSVGVTRSFAPYGAKIICLPGTNGGCKLGTHVFISGAKKHAEVTSWKREEVNERKANPPTSNPAASRSLLESRLRVTLSDIVSHLRRLEGAAEGVGGRKNSCRCV